jgi:hypothetical protein
VVAGFAVLFSLFPVIHFVIGIGNINERFPPQSSPKDNTFPIQSMGWFSAVFACPWILCGLAFSACLACAACNLARHSHRTRCMVSSGLSCAFSPFRTALGVFTTPQGSRRPTKCRIPFLPTTT